MQIRPEDIDKIEDIGTLNGSPVKLIRTNGGFYMAIGRQKGKIREEALAAGSHGAIVKFNLEKQFPEFQPSMMKSELFSENVIVEKHSHFLSQDLRKSGHDIYSIQKGNDIEFQITKHDVKLTSVNSSFENDALVIKDLNINKKFTRGLAGATTEKALSLNASKMRINKE